MASYTLKVLLWFSLRTMGLVNTDTPTTTPRVHLTSGFFVKEAPPSMILYSKTSQIIFNIRYGFTVPQKFDSSTSKEYCSREFNSNTKFSAFCSLADHLYGNLENLDERLNMIHTSFLNEDINKPEIPNFRHEEVERRRRETQTEMHYNHTLHRPKRQFIIAGALLAGIVEAKLYNYFGNSVINTRAMYDHLVEGVQHTETNLIQLAGSVSHLSKDLEGSMTNMVQQFNSHLNQLSDQESKVNKTLASLYTGESRLFLLLSQIAQELTRLTELFQYGQILNSCIQNRLPLNGINVQFLRGELEKLRENLAKIEPKYRLVIPIDDPSSYFHYKLAKRTH